MPSDVMAAIVQQLSGDATVAGPFGHTGATPKFFADEANVETALPYLVYSEPDEELNRVWGGKAHGKGTFELGVFDTTKKGARDKIAAVRISLNGMLQNADGTPKAPISLDDGGSLFYVHHRDGSSRPIETTAPGSTVTEFGRTLVFTYMVTRLDP